MADGPAKDAECRKCHRREHFAALCRSKQTVHEMTEEEVFHQDSIGMEQNKLFLGEVEAEGTGWHSKIKKNGEVVSRFLLLGFYCLDSY